MAQATRRRFLGGIGALLAALARAPRLLAESSAQRNLSFRHTHTGESLAIVYFADGAYVPEALESINHLLRDFRNGTVHPIDPHLLDALFALHTAVGSDAAFHVVSAYRSPQTNDMLHQRSSGVAEHSLHMQGRAIDIRVPGFDTVQLARLARRLQAGGVGYYRASDFVHVDTGAVRHWGDPID